MQEQENTDLRVQYERLGRNVTAIEAQAYVFPPSRPNPPPDGAPAIDAASVPGAPPAESDPSPEATTKTKKKKKKNKKKRKKTPSNEAREAQRKEDQAQEAAQGWYEKDGQTWNLLPNGYEVNDVYVAVKAHSWEEGLEEGDERK